MATELEPREAGWTTLDIEDEDNSSDTAKKDNLEDVFTDPEESSEELPEQEEENDTVADGEPEEEVPALSEEEESGDPEEETEEDEPSPLHPPKKESRAQKRIRELVRERNEARQLAQQHIQQQQQYEAQLLAERQRAAQYEEQAVLHAEKRLDAEEERLNMLYRQAQMEGDSDKLLDIQKQLVNVQNYRLQVNTHKARIAREKAAQPQLQPVAQQPAPAQPQPQPRPLTEQDKEAYLASLPAPMQSWYNANKVWFGVDPVMTQVANAMGYQIELEGEVEAGSKEYFAELDRRLAKYMEATGQRKPQKTNTRKVSSSPVAGGSRTIQGESKKNQAVKLTPEERQFAKFFDMSEAEWAREKLKLDKQGRSR